MKMKFLSRDIIHKDFAKSFIAGLVEVLGGESLKRILISAGLTVHFSNEKSEIHDDLTLTHFKRICGFLVENYGFVSAKGLMLQIGQATFFYLRKNILSLQVLGALENRLLPFYSKMESALNILADLMNEKTNTKISINSFMNNSIEIECVNDFFEGEDLIFWNQIIKGILMVYLDWIDSRRSYAIKENKPRKPLLSSTIFQVNISLAE